MKKGTQTYRTLQAFGCDRPLYTHEVVNITREYKSQARCTDLFKRGFIKKVGERETTNRFKEYRRQITDRGLLELGLTNKEKMLKKVLSYLGF